jgi:hypothetical protein
MCKFHLIIALSLRVAAVFTQGDKGLQVVGVFLAFSFGLHLVEVSRRSAKKPGSVKGTA